MAPGPTAHGSHGLVGGQDEVVEFNHVVGGQGYLDPGRLRCHGSVNQRLNPIGLDKGLAGGRRQPEQQAGIGEQGEHPAGGKEAVPAVQSAGGHERKTFQQFSDRHSGGAIVAPEWRSRHH